MKNIYLSLFLSILFVNCSDDSYDSVKNENLYMKLGITEYAISSKPGVFKLTIYSNTKWQSVSESSWLHPNIIDGTGNAVIAVAYDENDIVEGRTGSIIFSGEGVEPITISVKQSDKTFTNPIGGVPDPWIVKHEGYYYLCKAHGDAINISKSDKLSVLSGTKTIWKCPVDSETNKPWNTSHVWAPELHYINGKWYIYYTAGRPREELGRYQQRSGVLRAKTNDPMGEWEDMGMLYTGDNYEEGIKATTSNTLSAIDLSVFELNNQLYAVWSGAPKEADPEQILYLAKMDNPYTISSNRTIISRPNQPWELESSTINEGPAFLMNKEKNKVFIVYSCNGSWTKYYRLGYLMLKDISSDPTKTENWIKSPSSVFYRCDNSTTVDGVNGVGHCCFTKSPDDTEDWIVYHVKNRSDDTYGSGRSTFIQRFKWNEDGTPNLGNPVGWKQLVVVPSGEKD